MNLEVRQRSRLPFMSIVFACLGASAQDAKDRMPHEIQLPQPVEAPPRAKYKFDLSNKTDSVEKRELPSKGMRLHIAFLFPKFSKEMEEMLLQKKLNPLQQEQPQEN